MHLKKRPIALLEVLIALTLITFCAIPLIQQPIANHQAEMAQIERIETGRMAACAFAEVRETFLKKQIRWKQIPSLKEKSQEFALSDAQLQILPFPTRLIKRSYTIKTTKEKQDADGKIFRLLSVTIKIGRNSFTYNLTVFKDGEPQKQEDVLQESK